MEDFRKLSLNFEKYFDPSFVAKYIQKFSTAEAAEVIRQADLLLQNTFVFTDKWDMEPCQTPYSISLADWVTSPNGDPEWVYMLNRHDFLKKLWQAFVLTDDSRYIEKLRLYMLDWIEKNPITEEGTEATRTIDTGIRCMNWITLLMHLIAEKSISDDDARLIIESIIQQFRNLKTRYIGKYALSNWGVLQTTAICAGQVWLPDYLPEDITTWAWNELRHQLCLQILEDGSHWEQSPMYHVEVLNACSLLLTQLEFAHSLGHPLSEEAKTAMFSRMEWQDYHEANAGPGEGFSAESSGWLCDAVRVMSRHVLHTADPMFHQLPLGDSDVTDVRDVMCRSAVLLEGSAIYRFLAGDTVDMDSAWQVGAPGIARFTGIRPMRPRHTSWELKDSGNIFFRSQWDENASFTHLKNGTLGSSHGHADQTHLSLYYKGKPFLIDSGRYTYLEEDPLRPLLKKACAHNVCVIDGQSGGEPNGSWSYHSYDETLKNHYIQKDDIHYAEMGFHGHLKCGTPYLILRKLLAVDCGIWLSSQDIICQGTHQVKEYFHLHGQISVNNHGDHMTLKHGDTALNITSSEKAECRFGIVSDKYNEKHYAPILVKPEQMEDRMTSFTVIADADYKISSVPVYQMRRNEPVSPETAAAWDVVKPDGKKYTLILWNRETCRGDKLYTCHGVSVYGKAVVLVWENGICRTIRLRV